jgi:hypothetical protein
MIHSIKRVLLTLLVSLPFVPALAAQHEHHHHEGAADPEKSSETSSSSDLLNWSSGTSLNPSSWPMPMKMSRAGKWDLMWMGQAFAVSTQQTGPRGADKVYSSNWGMLAATRSLGRGSLMFRGMVSLEPLMITQKRYPLLFQTGETADGVAVVDGQHPHEFLMEVAAGYAHPLSQNVTAFGYYGAVGDPALGPVAFPHRASAMEFPQATLSHHWQDSTHIANNVVTGGLSYRDVRIEASGFHGREPNENRWNIDFGAMDSWAARLSYQPGRNWMTQFSAGRLERPEAHHADDIVRVTSSAHYTRPTSRGAHWSSSVIWARNYKTVAKQATQAFLAETAVPFLGKNLALGRFEWSQRDELFEDNHELGDQVFEETGKRFFDVAAYTIGYSREIGTFKNVNAAVGSTVSVYGLADALKPYYGSTPVSVNVFLRFRLAGE